MRKDRRNFLGGLLATGLIPRPTWADVGQPAFLSAAARSDGNYVLCGISQAMQVEFEVLLPARGHAAAAHPVRPDAVAFARRPGTFAVVIDCRSGETKAELHCPSGRHFYGHGAYSEDGNWLLTTENDFDRGRGRIGLWDVQAGYRRIDEFDSGGIGPHDIKRLPHSDIFVIANGGIDTHPDSGRTKLNIPTMAPNLSYFQNDKIISAAALPAEMHKNSIRHLAIGAQSDVAFGMQWQGDGTVTTLVGCHRQGQEIRLAPTTNDEMRGMDGYIGSIAFSEDSQRIAVTSPRGGRVQVYDRSTLSLDMVTEVRDVCGVAACAEGFALTSGTGALLRCTGDRPASPVQSLYQWDNHLVAL